MTEAQVRQNVRSVAAEAERHWWVSRLDLLAADLRLEANRIADDREELSLLRFARRIDAVIAERSR